MPGASCGYGPRINIGIGYGQQDRSLLIQQLKSICADQAAIVRSNDISDSIAGGDAGRRGGDYQVGASSQRRSRRKRVVHISCNQTEAAYILSVRIGIVDF